MILDDEPLNNRQLMHLQEMLLACLKSVFAGYFPQMNDLLMELADKSANQEQWDYFAQVRELKSRRTELYRLYESAVNESFNTFRSGKLEGRKKRNQNAPDLHLLPTDQQERDIAIATLARRLEVEHIEPLYALHQRLAIVNGGKKIDDDGSPYAPYQLARAFDTMLSVLNLKTRHLVFYYKTFEEILQPLLTELYKKANNYLIKEDILPNLHYEVFKNRNINKPQVNADGGDIKVKDIVEEVMNQARNAAPGIPAGRQSQPVQQTNSDSSELLSVLVEETKTLQPATQVERIIGDQGYQRSMFRAIRHLHEQLGSSDISVLKKIQNYSHDENGAVIMVPVQSIQLVNALDVIQKTEYLPSALDSEKVDSLTVDDFACVTSKLEQNISPEECIADDEVRAIDLVGMIFEYMLGDEMLPDAVKAVLSYLYTPFLKIALLAPDFFEQPTHPARQLLNILVDSGHRWVDADGNSQFNMLVKIKSTVQRVLSEFSNDVALFETLHKEMLDFNSRVSQKADVLEKRMQEKAKGEERLRVAKRLAYKEIKQKMGNRDYPAPVVVLLLHLWADYMTYVLLRYGKSSSEWVDSLQLVDDLLWSIEKKTDHSECSRLVVMQQDIPIKIRSAVKQIAFNNQKSENLIHLLIELQNSAFANQEVNDTVREKWLDLEQKAINKEIAEYDNAEESLSDQENEIVEKLRNIEFGTWIEFRNINGKRVQRLKVSWYNRNTMRYMFVNSAGQQVAIKSAAEIAKLVVGNEARIVGELKKPFFERALENILVRFKEVALS